MARPFFSGNYGSALGSTANAANLIAQAGKVQGQMYANLGQIAADTLDKFREKQEERKKEEAFERMGKKLPIETFAPFGVKTEEERDALLKDFKKKGVREEATMLAQLAQQGQARQGQQQFQNLMLGTQAPAVQPSDSSIRDFFRQEQANEQAAGLGGVTNPEQFRQGVARSAAQGNLNPAARALALNRFMGLQDAQAAQQAADTSFQRELALKNPPTTPGQETYDKEFAKSLIDFNEADVRKGLTQLSEASKALGESDTLTGPWVSTLPNFIGDRINPEAAAVRESVEEVVQRNLRLVLGAQFTEKEGERLISRAYNPKLSEKENKKRVERLMKSIESAMEEKLRARDYFRKTGTLVGFEMPSITSIESDTFDDGSPGVTQESIEQLRKKVAEKKRNLGL